MRSAVSLVIGANNGGPGRERLRYAVSDAKAMIQVLENLGGVSPDDSRLLVEPEPGSPALGNRAAAGAAGALAPEAAAAWKCSSTIPGTPTPTTSCSAARRSPTANCAAMLQALAADVRIAILDSCASGAFLRAKGGQKRPPFLFDAAYDMKGFAVMTSSSADEASQESERIRGSFFTRGADHRAARRRRRLRGRPRHPERSVPVRLHRDPAPDGEAPATGRSIPATTSRCRARATS